MGIEENIDSAKFPRQSNLINKEVTVCFNYNAENSIQGVVVRDDIDRPFRMMIKLVGGRYILSTECQYSFNNP